MRNIILQGDALAVLKTLPDESVHCCITSPPYFGLRDYGTAQWEGGDPDCDHRRLSTPSSANVPRDGYKDGFRNGVGDTNHANEPAYTNVCGKCGARRIDSQIGLEPTLDDWVAALVAVFAEVRRVLRKDGTLWLNCGDGYAAGGNGARDPVRWPKQSRNAGGFRATHAKDNFPGLKPKDLLCQPWRLAMALQADGWWLRGAFPWVKRSAMPESVKGSHASRHRITIEKYENLSRMRTEKGGISEGPSDLPGVQTREVSDRKTPLSAERERQGDSQSARGTSGRTQETAAVLSVGTGPGEQGQVRSDREGQSSDSTQGSEIPAKRTGQTEGSRAPSTDKRLSGASTTESDCERPLQSDGQIQSEETSGLRSPEGGGRSIANSDGSRLGRDSEQSQASLFLLQEAGDIDNGPRYPGEQGWAAREREHRASMSELQFGEEQSADLTLVDCPGCDECQDGYIIHLSAGRATSALEYVFQLTKSASYYCDMEAVRRKHTDLLGIERFTQAKGRNGLTTDAYEPRQKDGIARPELVRRDIHYNPAGRNLRNADLWYESVLPDSPYGLVGLDDEIVGLDVNTAGFEGAHFATFPEALVLPFVKMSTSEHGCCSECGAPWVRQVERTALPTQPLSQVRHTVNGTHKAIGQAYNKLLQDNPVRTVGWSPSCKHEAPLQPALILDPFLGSGTTALVAAKAGRDWLGIELSPAYVSMAERRIGVVRNRLL